MAINVKSLYFGKSGTTSGTNTELIQAYKLNSEGKTLTAPVFNFIAYQDCTVIIDGSDPIPFKANKEFLNPNFAPISKFTIVENGIPYWYMGTFKEDS